MSEIIGNNKKQSSHENEVNQGKCISTDLTRQVEVVIQMQHCGFDKKTEE